MPAACRIPCFFAEWLGSPAPTVPTVFNCPANSYIATKAWPITSFDDCACNWGYVKNGTTVTTAYGDSIVEDHCAIDNVDDDGNVVHRRDHNGEKVANSPAM